MSTRYQISEFDQARAAGMNANQAARWVTYLERKRAAGEEPIELWEALVQIGKARDEADVARVMRDLFNDAVAQLRDELLGEPA